MTGPQSEAGYRAGTGAHRAGRRVLRQAQAVSQRGFLFGHHLPGDGIHAGRVYGAVRHSADGGLAGAVAGDATGSGAEDCAAATALYRARRCGRWCGSRSGWRKRPPASPPTKEQDSPPGLSPGRRPKRPPVAVGMRVAPHPPHRSVRALLTHTVLTLDVLPRKTNLRVRMQDLDFR